MEITGKVIQKQDIQSGTSAATGKTWQSITFIIETIENYPRKVAIELFGEQRIKDNPVEIDQVYTISFDLESREFNGRWYTSARAWKVQEPASTDQSSTSNSQQAAIPPTSTFDELQAKQQEQVVGAKPKQKGNVIYQENEQDLQEDLKHYNEEQGKLPF